MKGKLLKPDGQVQEIEPLNGETFSLEELYRLLGCELIEIVHLHASDDLLVIDEEGKFAQCPEFNRTATEIARRHRAIVQYDYIVGKALLCNSDMIE